MILSMWYWIGMAAWLVLGIWSGWTVPDGQNRWVGFGSSLLPWLCVLAVGWQVFGGPVK